MLNRYRFLQAVRFSSKVPNAVFVLSYTVTLTAYMLLLPRKYFQLTGIYCFNNQTPNRDYVHKSLYPLGR
jgi:hypothetical protein